MTDLGRCDRGWWWGDGPESLPVERTLICSVATQEPDSMVVSVRGNLDMRSAPELRHRLLELLDPPVKMMILDVAALAFMDNSGAALLLAARRDAEDRGVMLQVMLGSARSSRALELTQSVGPVNGSLHSH
ncbi:MAG TPA: STAS domain-containing protein [Acidimicrobiia bacterium]